MSEQHASAGGGGSSNSRVLLGLGAVLVAYAVSAAMGLPQKGTELVNHSSAAEHREPAAAAHPPAAEAHDEPHPAYFMVLPFCLLLAAIALFPLMHATEHWWDNNTHKFYVAGGLGLVTLLYYLFAYGHPIDKHFLDHQVVAPHGSPAWELPWVIFQNSIFNDFVPFIILLFALFTICGGIRISGDLVAHPGTNTVFLLVGALLASFIGTTGAAMLLIRPLLETNAERKKVAHTVVFFIFIVCNCGGCLLPIGDPPLFIGYLKGVEFLWTLKLWKEWALVNGALLVIYFLWDTLFAYPHEAKRDIKRDITQTRKLTIDGLMPNAPLLICVVLATALLGPTKPFPGTNWLPWLYLREVVQLALVGVSLLLTAPRIRPANNFSYGAIVEVGALFIGIFICMQPALQILDVKGASLGIDTTAKFFWFTGALSSLLDNAPTYLVFFETAKTLPDRGVAEMADVAVDFLAAISLGAVFMGANTYIGNGPNFMVKTIAEKSGIKMPSFFGYMAYSFGVLIPLFIVITFVFFQG